MRTKKPLDCSLCNKLHEALERYGKHEESCDQSKAWKERSHNRWMLQPCSCGLTDVLTGVPTDVLTGVLTNVLTDVLECSVANICLEMLDILRAHVAVFDDSESTVNQIQEIGAHTASEARALIVRYAEMR